MTDFRFGDPRATPTSDARGGCCGKPVGCTNESPGCLNKPAKAESQRLAEEEVARRDLERRVNAVIGTSGYFNLAEKIAAAILDGRLTAEKDAREWRGCGFRWAGGGDHACRHEDGHPGRHVCNCRSWQPRSDTREAAQGVNPGPQGAPMTCRWEKIASAILDGTLAPASAAQEETTE